MFVPHFSADHTGATLFEMVHKISGAANLRKLLSNIPQERHQEAMQSIGLEAQARIIDPTHGCMLRVRQLLQLEWIGWCRARVEWHWHFTCVTK